MCWFSVVCHFNPHSNLVLAPTQQQDVASLIHTNSPELNKGTGRNLDQSHMKLPNSMSNLY